MSTKFSPGIIRGFYYQYHDKQNLILKDAPKNKLIVSKSLPLISDGDLEKYQISLRSLETLTTEELMEMCKIIFQFSEISSENFTVKRISEGDFGYLIHGSLSSKVNITYHFCVNTHIGSINCNMHFEESPEFPKDKFESVKYNIGECFKSANIPLPYTVIDYLRKKRFLLPYRGMTIQEILKEGYAVIDFDDVAKQKHADFVKKSGFIPYNIKDTKLDFCLPSIHKQRQSYAISYIEGMMDSIKDEIVDLKSKDKKSQFAEVYKIRLKRAENDMNILKKLVKAFNRGMTAIHAHYEYDSELLENICKQNTIIVPYNWDDSFISTLNKIIRKALNNQWIH